MKPHKHAEVLRALGDGKEVECRRRDCEPWQPLLSDDAQVELIEGGDRYEYRIKPEPRKGWYRVALMGHSWAGPHTETADCEESESGISNSGDFIRWLTDRIEYEVE